MKKLEGLFAFIFFISILAIAQASDETQVSESQIPPGSWVDRHSEQIAVIKELSETGAYIVAVLGIPFGLYIIGRDSKRDRLERELQANMHSYEIYGDYLNRCLERPDADAFEFTKEDLEKVGIDRETVIVFLHLISTMQTAFNLYKDQHRHCKRMQWTAWESYISMWTQDPRFRKAWELLGHYWDVKFQEKVNKHINS